MKITAMLLASASLLLLTVVSEAKLKFSEVMEKDFTVGWEFDGEDIIFEVSAPTLGWVGIGFSETKTMQKADLIIMGMKDGKPYAWDAYSEMTGMVRIDFDQDVTILDSAENGTTYMKIKRSLKSEDTTKDNDILKGDNNFLWAFGDKDKTEEILSEDYHWTNRGYRLLNTLGIKPETDATMPTTTQPTTPVSKANIDEVHLGVIDENFPYSIWLDAEETVHLKWNFDEENISMQFIAPTTGWIGIGFSQTSSMSGADLIIAGKLDNEPYILDCHSDKNGIPDVDEQQDVKLLESWENGTHTMATVIRKRITCDDDDKIIGEGTYRVIWAYGGNDIVGMQPVRSNYHMRNRGAKSLKLVNAVIQIDKNDIAEEEYKQFDIRPTNFRIPNLDTFYLCKLFKIPEEPEVHHVIGFDIVITPGNEKNVHHLVVFLCEDFRDQSKLGKDVECFSEMNPFWAGCSKMFAGWAVGMSNFRFPIEAGYPIGGKDGPKYVLLETHYDNPDLEPDIIDSSGVRFYYTENLRKYDAGLLTISQSIQGIFVPPNAERFRINGYCSNECFSQGFDGTDVEETTVFSVTLHGHLTAKSMKLRHFRGKKELEPIAKDDHYDFDYQESQFMDVKIRKGDSFIMQCDYDTIGKTNVTTGGLGTRNEMCTSFVFLYPALKLDFCDSRVPVMETEESFVSLVWGLGESVTKEEGDRIAKEAQEKPVEVMDVLATMVLNKVEWTDEKRKFAEKYMAESKRRPFCTYRQKLLLGYMQDIVVPKYEPFKEKNVCSLREEDSNTGTSIKIESTSEEVDSPAMLVVMAAALILVILIAAKLSL
uniref:DBH-like monooxygenase protein 1 homolog n=1 Tax=Styela clava TaxID=7725 RepID=UPI00193A252D|nr:DBH-like monooxygenase protein 1 homolog [Styela clava]XP_039261997.1 DBH-like monooxygenase protein 1 homolog [Styela clava]